MKKNKRLQKLWRHISEKVPPDDKHPVLIAVRKQSTREFDSTDKHTLHVMPGWSARTEALMNLSPTKRKGLSWDRKWVWWMPTTQPPERKPK